MAQGVDKSDTLFIVLKRGDGITAIADLQAIAYVTPHKPRRTVVFRNSNFPEFLVHKN